MSKSNSTAAKTAIKKWTEAIVFSVVYHVCLLAIVITAVEI